VLLSDPGPFPLSFSTPDGVETVEPAPFDAESGVEHDGRSIVEAGEGVVILLVEQVGSARILTACIVLCSKIWSGRNWG
jgi:hypothetical protein